MAPPPVHPFFNGFGFPKLFSLPARRTQKFAEIDMRPPPISMLQVTRWSHLPPATSASNTARSRSTSCFRPFSTKAYTSSPPSTQPFHYFHVLIFQSTYMPRAPHTRSFPTLASFLLAMITLRAERRTPVFFYSRRGTFTLLGQHRSGLQRMTDFTRLIKQEYYLYVFAIHGWLQITLLEAKLGLQDSLWICCI